jgi:hypothetical protein
MEDPRRRTYREEPVDEHCHRPGRRRSGVVVGVAIAALYAGGIAVIGHHWVLSWACAGLVVLAVLAVSVGKVIGIMDDPGGVNVKRPAA